MESELLLAIGTGLAVIAGLWLDERGDGAWATWPLVSVALCVAGHAAAGRTAVSEAAWACSFTLLCAAGLAFRVLPPARPAALRGVAAGLGLALWLAAVMWVHFGAR